MKHPSSAGDAENSRTRLLGAFALRRAAEALPWYDSNWLRCYVAALKVIDQIRPSMRADFIAAFDPLRTPPDFEVRKLDRVFDNAVMEEVRETIRKVPDASLEHHEAGRFGRLVVHDHEVFKRLQKTLVPLASELAGEALEPSYNFLSLYRELGVCQPHIDAPTAKWTLDVCIDQSDIWPIHVSQIVPWPDKASFEGEDWQERIKRSPGLRFSSFELQPGEAIWFSGSSQWHYRDSLTATSNRGFCNLLFFHFLPEGLSRIAWPENWPEIFGLPELTYVVGSSAGR